MYPFHLAIAVRDIDEARAFYTQVLNCKVGRSDQHWLDLDFFGHQLVCHLDTHKQAAVINPVDGHGVPVPHFGIVLTMPEWQRVSERLKQSAVSFVIEPYIRFKDQTGEQATLFFYDPSGNAIEIKAFNNIEQQLFAT